MNRSVLMGRLTKDPEIRTTQNGHSVASFTLACDRRFKDADGERQTDFIPCVAWRQTAEFANRYFSKGDRMLVEGTIQPRSWEDQEGQRRYITEVIVDQIYFCESKRQAASETATYGYSDPEKSLVEPQQTFLSDQDDDTALPFDMQ